MLPWGIVKWAVWTRSFDTYPKIIIGIAIAGKAKTGIFYLEAITPKSNISAETVFHTIFKFAVNPCSTCFPNPGSTCTDHRSAFFPEISTVIQLKQKRHN